MLRSKARPDIQLSLLHATVDVFMRHVAFQSQSWNYPEWQTRLLERRYQADRFVLHKGTDSVVDKENLFKNFDSIGSRLILRWDKTGTDLLRPIMQRFTSTPSFLQLRVTLARAYFEAKVASSANTKLPTRARNSDGT